MNQEPANPNTFADQKEANVEISTIEPKVETVIENQNDMNKPTKTRKGKCGIILLAWLTDYLYDWECDWC